MNSDVTGYPNSWALCQTEVQLDKKELFQHVVLVNEVVSQAIINGETLIFHFHFLKLPSLVLIFLL